MSQNKDNSDFFVNIEWGKSSEDLLVQWGDHAACFAHVYDRSYRKFNRTNNRVSIPIICMSTVLGTLSIGINSIVPEEFVDAAQKVIGSVNLIIAIATTIQNHFRWAQLSEMHLNQANEWAKFERNIKIELSIEKENRKSAAEFVRLCRYEYEKLVNSNPIIPIEIIDEFKNTLRKLNLEIPDILSTMKKTTTFEEKFKNLPKSRINSPTPPSYIQRLKSVIPGTKAFKESKYPLSPKSFSSGEISLLNQRKIPDIELDSSKNEIKIELDSSTPSYLEKERKERLEKIRKSLVKTESVIIDNDIDFKTEIIKNEDNDNDLIIHMSPQN